MIPVQRGGTPTNPTTGPEDHHLGCCGNFGLCRGGGGRLVVLRGPVSPHTAFTVTPHTSLVRRAPAEEQGEGAAENKALGGCRYV